MKCLPLLLLFLTSALGPLAAQPPAPSAKRQNLMKLLELTGGKQSLEKVINAETVKTQMWNVLRPEDRPVEQRPQLEEFIAEFGKEFAAEAGKHSDALVEKSLDILEKYYTSEDVQASLTFYQTPAGKEASPARTADCPRNHGNGPEVGFGSRASDWRTGRKADRRNVPEVDLSEHPENSLAKPQKLFSGSRRLRQSVGRQPVLPLGAKQESPTRAARDRDQAVQ